jgi:hypothetical protein
MRRAFFALASLVLLGGCSTSLAVRDVSDRKIGEELGGIPFRVKVARTIRVWVRQPPDATGRIAYQAALAKTIELADEDVLYALGFEADTFASKRFEVKLNDDGTLASVHLKSENKTGEVIAATGKQATSVADAGVSYSEQVHKAEIAQLKSASDLAAAQATMNQTLAQSTLDREGNLVAALKAYQDVEAAQRALQWLAPDAAASQRAEAASALRIAQFAANVAYQKAGLAPPFPGVFP